MYRSLISTLAFAATAFAAAISIDVGQGGSLTFSPNSMTAAVGDTLEFHFFSGSGGHSVVSGAFASPCEPDSNAIFSGYIPGNDSGNMTFVTTVNSTDSIWFYCSLDHHCQAGMVGVVNPAGNTIDDYMSAARMASAVSAPAALQGGMLTTMSAGAMSSTMSMSSGVSTGMSMTSMSATTTGSMSGSAASTASSHASSSASVASSKSSSAASTAATATTTPSAAGRSNEMSTVLGLAVVVGGLVALMA